MRKKYPCIEIHLGKIRHNTKEIRSLCRKQGIEVVGVSKVFCAKKPIVKAMLSEGIEIIGDSRIENLKKLVELPCKKMLLRIPMGSNAKGVVKYSDISLNSELHTIKRLSEAAKDLNKIHQIILMIDVGDLREGILEQDVFWMVKEIESLSNIELIGIGTNLTCYGGIIPDESNLGKLIMLKEKIENELNKEIGIVSGGNSSSLHLVLNHSISKGINQLRIGEAIVLGRETSYGTLIPGCYNDCFILKGEIIEIKYKPSLPSGVVGMDAFGNKPIFIDKGIIKRAIIALGKQDISIEGLSPMDSSINLLGGSSDHLIIDITLCETYYQVGDIVEFKMNYGSLLMAMTSPYVKKYYLD